MKWKIIQQFPKYKISDKGYIINIKTKKRLKHYKNSNGYKRVKLYKNIKEFKQCFIHHLVFVAFSEVEHDKKLFIDHIDRNKNNNSIENLRLVTRKENNLNRSIPKHYKKRRK